MAELVTLARPYAKAVFEVACAEGRLAEWQNMLLTLAAVVSDEKVAALLAQPSLTADQQASAVTGLCGDALTEKAANLVGVLSANRRLPLLPEVAGQFAALKAEHEKTVGVEILSAFPLDKAVADRLAQALGRKWQCQVKLETQVDPSLLGGAIIKAGDTVIDASVRGRMLRLADALAS